MPRWPNIAALAPLALKLVEHVRNRPHRQRRRERLPDQGPALERCKRAPVLCFVRCDLPDRQPQRRRLHVLNGPEIRTHHHALEALRKPEDRSLAAEAPLWVGEVDVTRRRRYLPGGDHRAREILVM